MSKNKKRNRKKFSPHLHTWFLLLLLQISMISSPCFSGFQQMVPKSVGVFVRSGTFLRGEEGRCHSTHLHIRQHNSQQSEAGQRGSRMKGDGVFLQGFAAEHVYKSSVCLLAGASCQCLLIVSYL